MNSREPLRFLCFVRPWTQPLFEQIIGNLFQNSTVGYIGDDRFVGNGKLWARFHAKLKDLPTKSSFVELPSFICEREYEDIVTRCRLLREISPKKARRLVAAMGWALAQEIDFHRPDIIFSLTVDNYCTHLLKLYSQKKGIAFYGMASVVFNGFHLITALGETRPFRSPSEQEVTKTLSELENNLYRPTYLPPQHLLRKKMFIRWGREVIKAFYMPLMRLFSGDFYNYHYWSSQIIAQSRSHPRFVLAKRRESVNWRQRAAQRNYPTVYLPLQYHPECNSEYWPPSDFQDYEKSVIKVLEFLVEQKIVFLVKEHPNMVGYRNPNFYKQLSSLKNVIFVPNSVSSRECLNATNLSMTWSGSVGIESCLLGKPVITLGRPYYNLTRLHLPISNFRELETLTLVIEKATEISPLTHEEKKKYVEQLLARCMPGNSPDLIFFTNTIEASENNKVVREALQTDLESWLESQIATSEKFEPGQVQGSIDIQRPFPRDFEGDSSFSKKTPFPFQMFDESTIDGSI